MKTLAKYLLAMVMAIAFTIPSYGMNSSMSFHSACPAHEIGEAAYGGWLEEKDGVKILHVSGSN
ncbi:MAG: hypothetical protein J7J34_07025, partial [Thermoplasmata archaeon]|nr:hypothetical protein [Thermoplasmata archaeon]